MVIRQVSCFDLAALVATALSLGCAITDYPIITDDRGGYSGVIRTGHRAYIVPSYTAATLYPDGSDEVFHMIEQNQYGDQKMYAFNNYDPTSSVLFLDQTYCDWRYEGCAATRAWSPHQQDVDNRFDYEAFPDCSGFRTIFSVVAFSSRIGECGDVFRGHGAQQLAAEFANLATTTWRGEQAYVVPVNADTTTILVGGELLPIYGEQTILLDSRLRAIVPMTPLTRHSLRWLLEWTGRHSGPTTLTVTYGSFSTSVAAQLLPKGIAYNMTRY